MQLPSFSLKLVKSTEVFDVKFKNEIISLVCLTISLRTQSASGKYNFVSSPVYVHFCNFLV